jgi:hypothetical protein
MHKGDSDALNRGTGGSVMSQLKTMYEKEVAPKLTEMFGYKNVMQVPKLEKIVLNMGLGEAIQNVKLLESAVEELSLIAGQKAVVTRARKSIAAFKVREGMPIGCCVTLRRNRMYDFLYKLVNVALARVRISREFQERRWTVGETIPWGSGSTSFFRKLTMTRSKKLRASTFRSSLLPRPMRKARDF